jgi:hypothetical protein
LRGSFFAAIPTTNASFERRSARFLKRRRFSRSRRDSGGYDFLIDPDLRADKAPLLWLPHIDPTAVVIVPAPEAFGHSRSLSGLTPRFARDAPEGQYWLTDASGGRLPLVLTNGASATTPGAVLIPIDADFGARADAAMRLWRMIAGKPRGSRAARLTRQRRQRLTLALRALDGRLAGESYRVIGQGLFGRTRIPAGPGWKTHDLRDRTIRLVRAGLALMRGGYRDLLQHARVQRE